MRTSSAKAKEFFLTLSRSNQVAIVDEIEIHGEFSPYKGIKVYES